MRKVLIMPGLAAVLLAAACGENDAPTTVEPVDPRASVRFFNAMTPTSGVGGFTVNGQFASGSALGPGRSTETCVQLDAGPRSFGFGTANAGGTGLSGTLATLTNQNIAASGKYTVAAYGSGIHALLFLLDNNFSGSLSGNQAAVRFVSLAPSMTPFSVLSGTGSGATTPVASNLAPGAPTTFTTVTSGANAYTVLSGQNTAISGSAGTLNLQAGSVNTIAIVPGAAAGTFQLVNIPRC